MNVLYIKGVALRLDVYQLGKLDSVFLVGAQQLNNHVLNIVIGKIYYPNLMINHILLRQLIEPCSSADGLPILRYPGMPL